MTNGEWLESNRRIWIGDEQYHWTQYELGICKGRE